MAMVEALERLAILSPAVLAEEWRRVHRSNPPRLSPELMRHGIAYALQEKALGKLPATISRQLDAGQRPSAGATLSLSPGTRLVRSWNGRTINVLVADAGYKWEDRSYRSLSAIAREVTGTAWSGPRFFGLTGRG